VIKYHLTILRSASSNLVFKMTWFSLKSRDSPLVFCNSIWQSSRACVVSLSVLFSMLSSIRCLLSRSFDSLLRRCISVLCFDSKSSYARVAETSLSLSRPSSNELLWISFSYWRICRTEKKALKRIHTISRMISIVSYERARLVSISRIQI